MMKSYFEKDKTLWEKEKMLVTSIFSFSHNVLKSLLLSGLCGKELKTEKIVEKRETAGYYQFFIFQLPTSVAPVRSVQDKRRRGCWPVRSLARSVFFTTIDDSHFDRIHSPLTVIHCFDEAMFWKENCAE